MAELRTYAIPLLSYEIISTSVITGYGMLFTFGIPFDQQVLVALTGLVVGKLFWRHIFQRLFVPNLSGRKSRFVGYKSIHMIVLGFLTCGVGAMSGMGLFALLVMYRAYSLLTLSAWIFLASMIVFTLCFTRDFSAAKR